MTNLSTTYLGLKLESPIVVSAGPLCKDIANIKKMEEAGAGAIVLHSLFEEQINLESNELDQYLSQASDVGAEANEMFPDMDTYNTGPDAYLEHIRKAKAAVKVPVVASLNGMTNGGWIRYAKLMEEAGADALELNIYYLPTDPNVTGVQIEEMTSELVANVNSTVRIPLAVKLSPFYSSIANVAKNLDKAGADALVLFNRFYQPDFDLEALEVVPTLMLSRSNEIKLRLHWAAILFGKISADIAITGGVHTAQDVIKSMMAGAKVAMTTSALLEHGIDYLKTLNTDLANWLEEHEYASIEQMQGSMSHKNVAHPSVFERANYMKVLSTYTAGVPVR